MPISIVNLSLHDLHCLEQQSGILALPCSPSHPLFQTSLPLQTPKAVTSLGTPKEHLLDSRIASFLTSPVVIPILDSPESVAVHQTSQLSISYAVPSDDEPHSDDVSDDPMDCSSEMEMSD
ncbi:hypothetical protein GEMRC1_004337 [Eukaryota sp. GEM-RC1]